MIDPTSVVVADDHPRARELARRALESAGFVVVAEASDAAGAVSAALAHRPDVCLFDINMPGGGVRATAEVSIALPETVVVMYTVSAASGDLFAALRAGARGYLLKDTDPARLPLALKGVINGEAAIPRHLVSRVMEEFRTRDRPRRLRDGPQQVSLTQREWDVLELLRQGLTTAEIATRLFVTSATVRSHVASIVRKLKVQDRAEALALLDEHLGDSDRVGQY